LIRQNRCCLVDVREPVEYAEEHLASARSIPLKELPKRAGEIERDRPVVVMCLGGKRSEQAREKLEVLGMQNVRSLEGGLSAWKAAGLPIERSQEVGLPLMRQVQLVIGLGTLAGSVLAIFVDALFALIPAFFGAGLILAGTTGWCGLAIFLSKMPWNRVSQAASNPPVNHGCCR
jgi:rhodanese-related sulfurtransferase